MSFVVWCYLLEAWGLCSAVGAIRTGVQTDPEYLIDTWETADGLPESSATAMVQREDGYLWFGTFKGLVRFDGVRFTVFTPTNLPQLPSDGIVNLHLDRSGRLWISTFNGLVLCEGDPARPSTGSWRTFTSNDGWTGDYVRTFAERANGDLLITTFNGKVLEFSNGALRALPDPPGQQGQGYFGVADESGQWWVVQHRFTGRWDGQKWIRTVDVPSVAIDGVGCAQARDGGFWLLFGQELRKYQRGTEVARIPLPETPGGVWSLFEDSEGAVWVCTYTEGACRVKPSGQMRRWTTTTGLSYRSTRFAFEDHERNLWIGTSGGGLVRFKARRFQTLGLERGLSERVVKSIWPESPESVWIATYGNGLFHSGRSGLTNVPLPGFDSSFLYAQTVLTDHAGRVWVGTYQQGLWRSESNQFKRIPFDQTGGNDIAALFEDSQKRLWIGGTRVTMWNNGRFRVLGEGADSPLKGVGCFAEDNQGAIWLANSLGVFRWRNERSEAVPGIPSNICREVTCLKSTPDGSMWMGTQKDGLARWRDGRVDQLRAIDGLPVEEVRGILEDGNGIFWLASGRGIVRVPRSSLEAVAEGSQRQLLCQLLGIEDGLPSVECTGAVQPTCARDGEGQLWFATSKGVAMTHPLHWKLNQVTPPVQIEEVTYQLPLKNKGRELGGTARQGGGPQAGPRVQSSDSILRLSGTELRSEAPSDDSLVLPPGGQRLEIRFTALSFVAPEKVRFQVKLEGYDPEWQDIGDRRLVQFLSLPPRAYVFRVRAANNDGVWNDSGARLAFSVEPYVWQRWWFRSGLAISLIAGISWAVWSWSRLRYRQELLVMERTRQQQTELAHVARVSTMGELAASVAHELNQPLGAILSNAEAAEMLLAATPPALAEVKEILADIRRDDERAGEVIHRMRALLHKREMERQPVELNAVAQAVLPLVQAEASLRRITITTDLASDLPPVLGDRIHLQQVLLNLIMNAFEAMSRQVSSERVVTIRTAAAAEATQELSVSDSGPGIDPGKLPRLFDPFFTTKSNGMGMGLSIARRIVEAHHGRIWAENNAARGATFRVRLLAQEN
jgi:signal transduction histidine kinase/ligand-binding sensor domain-containing protein